MGSNAGAWDCSPDSTVMNEVERMLRETRELEEEQELYLMEKQLLDTQYKLLLLKKQQLEAQVDGEVTKNRSSS